MTTLEITSVSSKGQVVIPGAMRTRLGIKAGDKLAVITDGESVLMKPLETPKLSVFRRLIADSRVYAARTGLKKDDVPKALRRVRDANRSRR
jgi:antitoxin PrlF